MIIGQIRGKLNFMGKKKFGRILFFFGFSGFASRKKGFYVSSSAPVGTESPSNLD